MDEADEYTIFQRSRTDKTYVGPSFPTLNGRRLRIANKCIDGGEGYEYAVVKDEIVLRATPGGRFQIKATFVEDDRSFQTVTIQKFTGAGRAREYFTLLPGEIAALLKFLSNIKRIHFPNEGKINVTDADLDRVVDERWDPPVTLAVRLVSVLADGLEHAGQAAYIRGVAERQTRG